MSATDKARVLAAEQAAEWLVRLQDTEALPKVRTEFTTWLQFSPAHVHEFLNARAMWEALSGDTLQALPDRSALLAMARTADTADVVPLSGALPEQRRHMPMAHAHKYHLGIAASLILALGSGSVWLSQRPADNAVYTTATGEQTTKALKDGSTIALNTRSQVRLDWSEQFRDVYLDDGEALFQVARDPRRPFRVWSGNTLVRAIGTRFNVYRTRDAVTVTVLEGKVEIKPDGSLSAASALVAGEQARIHKHLPVETTRLAQPDKAVAWRERRLEFEGTPLSEVIAEFNRYHPTPLLLDNAELAARRINGTFDAADREALVAFLKTFEDVQIEMRSDGIRLK